MDGKKEAVEEEGMRRERWKRELGIKVKVMREWWVVFRKKKEQRKREGERAS